MARAGKKTMFCVCWPIWLTRFPFALRAIREIGYPIRGRVHDKINCIIYCKDLE